MGEYRRVESMNADEMLECLTREPQFQIDLFVQMGGDPDDHNYAYLSFLTKQLRARGVPVHSSRHLGVWLGSGCEMQAASMQLSLAV